MIELHDLSLVEMDNPEGKWYVHNGFHEWIDGAPADPTPITHECVLKILNYIADKNHEDCLIKLKEQPIALPYAEENDELFLKTNNNRLIAYITPKDCIFEESSKPTSNFEI